MPREKCLSNAVSNECMNAFQNQVSIWRGRMAKVLLQASGCLIVNCMNDRLWLVLRVRSGAISFKAQYHNINARTNDILTLRLMLLCTHASGLGSPTVPVVLES